MIQRGKDRRQAGTAGQGVDAYGGGVIDPTENVKALMEASIKSLTERQDLIARIDDEKIKRIESDAIWAEKIAILVRAHNADLRHMEADRIDKIRAVDVQNATTTATQLLSAVNNYASAQERTAETLRSQVAATAKATAEAQAALFIPLVERVATLEKASYKGEGKSAVTDPALQDLVVEMRQLAKNGSERTGKSEGIATSWMVLVAVIGMAMALYFGLQRNSTTPPTNPTPQVIVVPAPITPQPTITTTIPAPR